MTERGKAIWTLALLSPIVAELMSGSSPPLEFFNPIMFAGLLGMYGAGALLVREFTASWGKGWASIIILGAAYGIIEEGLAVKSFFNPGWEDLGDLDVYGRFWSTNWVWAVWLTIFHSTISISVPILVTGMLYPQFRATRLLTERQFRLVLVLFTIDIGVFALVFLFNYVPPLAQYLLTIGVVALLFYMAKRVPANLVSARHVEPSWRPWKFYLLGLLMLAGNFFIASSPTLKGFHPLGTMAVLLAISAFVIVMLQHKLGSTNNLPHKASFVGGLLTLWVLFGILLESAGVAGMSLVAVAAALLIIDLNRFARGKRPFVFFKKNVKRAYVIGG